MGYYYRSRCLESVSLSLCLWSSESKRVEVIIATRFAAPDIGAYYHLYYCYPSHRRLLTAQLEPMEPMEPMESTN